VAKNDEKVVIMATHGPDDPELATIPFVMAAAAVACDMEVVMGFQGDGCRLVQKGVAEKVTAPEFAPLKGLIDDVRELGGKFLVCSPCVKSRHIEDELVEGAEVVAAARFVTELSSAGTSLVY